MKSETMRMRKRVKERERQKERENNDTSKTEEMTEVLKRQRELV